jgi:hypothetical protein
MAMLINMMENRQTRQFFRQVGQKTRQIYPAWGNAMA